MRQASKSAQLRAGDGTLAGPVTASSAAVTPRSSCLGHGGGSSRAPGTRYNVQVRRHAACDQPAAITAAPAASSVTRRR